LLFAVVVCSPNNNNNSSDNALGDDDDDAHLCVRAQCVLAAAIPRWFICSAIFSVMVGTHRLWAGTVFERCCLHGHCYVAARTMTMTMMTSAAAAAAFECRFHALAACVERVCLHCKRRSSSLLLLLLLSRWRRIIVGGVGGGGAIHQRVVVAAATSVAVVVVDSVGLERPAAAAAIGSESAGLDWQRWRRQWQRR
jgi:hypothetical protein